MADRLFVASFEREEDILGVTREARKQGYEIVDTYTPYAVHGLDKAQGLKPSRLTWACFLFGLTGCVGAIWLQYWTSAIDWPINVGGKPFNSLPAFIPVIFELTVLSAGVGVVLVLLLRCGLLPGREPKMSGFGVTCDRFVLVLREGCASFDPEEAREMCESFNVAAIEEMEARP